MELYARFILWLAVGLAGLGLVLKIVLDEFFGDWNAALELHGWARSSLTSWMHRHEGRTEDWLLDLEKAKTSTANSMRLIDQRREQLRELASVEQRLLPAAAEYGDRP